MKKILFFVLGAALLAGCGTMQGGFGKPAGANSEIQVFESGRTVV